VGVTALMPTITDLYQTLYARYGAQRWWPAETPFEVMVGAILTQNAAWQNVERAINNLKQSRLLTPEAILSADISSLAERLRPSGYFNIKAARLRNYCRWYLDQGGMGPLQQLDTASLRLELLLVKGVGPETADDILLYAFGRPVFVIDAYTRRIFSRVGLIDGAEGYEWLRRWFEGQWDGVVGAAERVAIFSEYHALIVIHAKQSCRKRPDCSGCPLAALCQYCVEKSGFTRP
jgi:endonuclease-3 related protein